MSNLQEFKFQSSQLRVETDEHGNPLFCAKDVCLVLGYSNDRDAVLRHCKAKGVVKRDTLTDGGTQQLTFIDEGNLYRLIIKSNKPEAEPFEAWVCDEVLPTIRKTGSYEHFVQSSKDNSDDVFWITVDEWNAALFATSKSSDGKANRQTVLTVEKELASGKRSIPQQTELFDDDNITIRKDDYIKLLEFKVAHLEKPSGNLGVIDQRYEKRKWYWTQAQIDDLQAYYNQGLSNRKISELTGRSISAINSAMSRYVVKGGAA